MAAKPGQSLLQRQDDQGNQHDVQDDAGYGEDDLDPSAVQNRVEKTLASEGKNINKARDDGGDRDGQINKG